MSKNRLAEFFRTLPGGNDQLIRIAGQTPEYFRRRFPFREDNSSPAVLASAWILLVHDIE